jgi:repressor of nif and glnA expression
LAIAAKIDQLTYTMDFDLARREGSVVVNVSLSSASRSRAIPKMAKVFRRKARRRPARGALRSGQACVGDVADPRKVGVGTVCSITFSSGVLLRHGIPVTSRWQPAPNCGRSSRRASSS